METDSAENAERISRRLEVSRLFGVRKRITTTYKHLV